MPKNSRIRGKLAFVMGGGKFGTNALNYLTNEGAKVLVVDIDSNCKAISNVDILGTDLNIFDTLKPGQSTFLKGDAGELLAFLLDITIPEIIVTAISGNAIARVIKSWLAKRKMELKPYSGIVQKVLQNIPSSLVLFFDEKSGIIVTSYMPSNMRCKENCMPPKNFCALTGRPKFASMNRILEFSLFENTNVSGILNSQQLTGGLGAINGNDLFNLLKKLDNNHKSYTLSIGVACNCHGIVNFYKVIKN
ncbi:MAG: hypothetical protein P8X91_03505 [Candidatus Bathyarchaeota archaeon]|jgi:hypothetical protein